MGAYAAACAHRDQSEPGERGSGAARHAGHHAARRHRLARCAGSVLPDGRQDRHRAG